SHDPLLEWALRNSGSGLASLPEGSEEGLRRLTRSEVVAAAIHLHRLEGDDEQANPEAVAAAPGLHDAVVIAFARREQGLLVKSGNPLKLTDMASVAARKVRVAQRPAGAGAQAVRIGRADCGVATRGVALAAGLDFVPITWERFDLVLRQRDYFLPGPQALFAFMREAAFRDRAEELGGYDVGETGSVRLVN